MMRRIAFALRKTATPLVAGAVVFNVRGAASWADDLKGVPETNAPSTIPTPSVKPDEDPDEWLAEKQKCPLCKMFLDSPCRDQFIAWAQCVDNAKANDEDFVEKCACKFEPLLKCQGDNSDYFSEIMKAMSDDEDEDDSNSDSSSEDSDNELDEQSKETEDNKDESSMHEKS